MYLLNDSDTAVSCCGRILEWEVEHSTSGFGEFMVWRPLIGGKYKLVGMNSFLLNGWYYVIKKKSIIIFFSQNDKEK